MMTAREMMEKYNVQTEEEKTIEITSKILRELENALATSIFNSCTSIISYDVNKLVEKRLLELGYTVEQDQQGIVIVGLPV